MGIFLPDSAIPVTKYLFGSIGSYTVVEEILKVISTGFASEGKISLDVGTR